MKIDEMVIRYLSYLLRTYDGIVKLTTASKNRSQAMNPDAKPEHQTEIQLMESLKDKIARQIGKQLEFWPIWTEWMKGVPGCGPYIAGNLIMLYYYRFVPICKKCDADLVEFKCPECNTEAKGGGILKTRIEEKDFEDISSWWHYLGRHIKNGKMPKRKSGEKCDWSSLGRVVTYQLADQFNRQKPEHSYKNFLLARKKKREETHPEATKGHRLNMAKNESVKLFLAHFWTVARTIDNKPVTKPYAGTILGHTGIIDPFYWDGAA